MLPELDEFLQQETEQKTSFSDQFIEDYITSQKAKIETRKLIQEMLFFVSCQVASASLAVVLFQFAVQVVFTTWLCLFVAWIPSLSNLCEVNFQKTEEGWTLQIMKKPLIAIIKFTTAVGIVTVNIYSISNEIHNTMNQIYAVYDEIQRYETPRVERFLPPYFWQVVFASIGIVLIVGMFRKKEPF